MRKEERAEPGEVRPPVGEVGDGFTWGDLCGVAVPVRDDLVPPDRGHSDGGIGDLGTAVVEAREHHPVLRVPVDDGREGEVIQAVAGDLERHDIEADLASGCRQPFKCRAGRPRSRHVAQPREGDVHPVPFRNHRQTGDAAVHLVELVDEREPFPPPGIVRCLARLHRGALRQNRATVELCLRNGLPSLSQPTGQYLRPESERDPGLVAEVPPRDHLLDPPGEFREASSQLLEAFLVELPGLRGAQRLHGCHSRLSRHEGSLAKDVAGLEVADGAHARARRHRRLEAPVLHDEHGVPGLTLADHYCTGLQADRLKNREHCSRRLE